MALRDDIEAVRSKLLAGSFANEAMVSQGVVLRLLAALGWPVFDEGIVFPQFQLSSLRVDFALCFPASKPKLLIEVKNVGKAGEAQQQLFQYAFHAGAQLAVLTDGRDWNFYLPGASGDYDERRFYRLDLMARDADECERRLKEFLSFEAVKSGDALRSASRIHEDAARRNEFRRAIPEAWTQLHREPDSLLVDLLIEKTAAISGFTPDRDEVAEFLVGAIRTGEPFRRAPDSTPAPLLRSIGQPVSRASASDASARGDHAQRVRLAEGYAITLFGERTVYRSAIDMLHSLLEKLALRDSTFLGRMSVRAVGRSRRLVAQDKRELYGDRIDLADEFSEKLPDGWWMGTNYANREKEKYIRMAIEVAGITPGRDVKIEFPEAT